LRRSTDAHQEESLETQRRGAVDYCKTRGWIIVEEFVDDAVSRAEFKKRPGLIRMLNHAGHKTFRLVVMRDESRLAGDISRTGLVIQDLADAGVGIVYYYTDELVSLDGAVDKFLVAARNFASELEREKISSRTYEHLMQKAKAGKPAGGISYGYAIHDKQYVVREHEAVIVRRIFAEYADGCGQRTIARRLNDERVASPRAGLRGTGSWSPSAVRAILKNPRYIGQGRYNQTRKLYRGGTKVRERRALSEHFSYSCPAIIDQATWDAVLRRFDGNATFGSRSDAAGPQPRYLLTGISRCAQCGGPITVGHRKSGQKNTRVYLCAWFKNRGRTVCPNNAMELVDEVDAQVIAALRQLITPDIVSDVIRQVRELHAERRAAAPAHSHRLRAEVETLRKEVARLTRAIAASDDPPGALLQAVAERDKRMRQAELDLAQAESTSDAIEDALAQLENEARDRLAELTSQALNRDVLLALTDGEKLRFHPSGRKHKVVGSVGVSGRSRPDTPDPYRVASPAGFDTVRNALAALPRVHFPA
jgi:site-specific DNA recombinase